MEYMLEEIEKGNCYLDETAYTLWEKNQEQFLESIRKQFYKIEEGGLEEAIAARYTICPMMYTGCHMKAADSVRFTIHR